MAEYSLHRVFLTLSTFTPFYIGTLKLAGPGGDVFFLPPPYSLVFYPRSIKFVMQNLTGIIFDFKYEI